MEFKGDRVQLSPGCFTSENRLHKEVPNVRQAILACLFLINVMAFRGSFGLS
jgi:hypothetical protein